jgi:hypothetical protein
MKAQTKSKVVVGVGVGGRNYCGGAVEGEAERGGLKGEATTNEKRGGVGSLGGDCGGGGGD